MKTDEPPRIVFIIGQKGICNAYVVAGGIKIEVQRSNAVARFLLLCLGFGVPEAIPTARIPPSVHHWWQKKQICHEPELSRSCKEI